MAAKQRLVLSTQKQMATSGEAPELHRVVCAIDANMVFPLAVLVSSMSQSATKTFRLTVGYLDGTLPEAAREYLATIFSHLGIAADFLNLDNDARFITQGHISPTTFAKFLLGDAISDQHLWLDADTVVLPGWDGLFDEIATASAAEGLVVALRGTDPSASANSDPSDLPFNAGVLGWPQGKRRDWQAPLASLAVVDTQEQYLFNILYSQTAKWVSEKFNTLTYRLDKLNRSDLPFVVHYAGPHKPWHLVPSLRHRCLIHDCPWVAWFEAEDAFLISLSNTELLAPTRRYRESAVSSGRLQWGRESSGYRLLRLLQWLGPLAKPLVGLLSLGRRWIPRGTHPLH